VVQEKKEERGGGVAGVGGDFTLKLRILLTLARRRIGPTSQLSTSEVERGATESLQLCY